MGFFQDILDGFGDLLTSISDSISDSRREEERNKTRQSIKELTYTPLDPSVADDIERRKPKNYTGPHIDRFLECIRQGRAEYVELLGISAYDDQVDQGGYGDNSVANYYYYQTYFKLADPVTGTVYKEAVSAWINKTKLPMEEVAEVDAPAAFGETFVAIEPSAGKESSAAGEASAAGESSASGTSSAGQETEEKPEVTKNPDPVDPSKYPHLFILHYFLKEREYYRALTKEQFEDMVPGIIYVKTSYPCFYERGNHEW